VTWGEEKTGMFETRAELEFVILQLSHRETPLKDIAKAVEVSPSTCQLIIKTDRDIEEKRLSKISRQVLTSSDWSKLPFAIEEELS
jgi:hypothetical protein